MKIKCRPEDFRVEERTDVAPSSGPHALYRLVKRSLGTPEVVAAIQRRWDVARERLSFGGLKDRHAVAVQHLTIYLGPARRLAQENFELEYLGQVPHPFGPKDIKANRFDLVIRDLEPGEVTAAREALDAAGRDGLPNYFDDQRFGSLGESGEYIGRAWCEGRWERAVWLALAEPNEHDRPEDREQKRILRETWGDWPKAKAALEKSHRRSIVTFLSDRPGDYKGALGRLDHDLRSIWLSAFQSHLWNRMLVDLVEEVVPEAARVRIELKAGPLAFFGPLEAAARERLASARLALPSARAKGLEGPERERMERVLKAEGLTLSGLRIKYPKDSFFSKGDRAALFRVGGLRHGGGPDELYPRRRKLELSFELPRGSYATILVKRITRGALGLE